MTNATLPTYPNPSIKTSANGLPTVCLYWILWEKGGRGLDYEKTNFFSKLLLLSKRIKIGKRLTKKIHVLRKENVLAI